MAKKKESTWRYVAFAILLVLAAGGWYRWWSQPLPVAMGTVSVGPMEVYVEEDGKTRLKDRYVVSSPLFGTSVRIGLKPGDKVEAGKTILATIHPTAPGLLDARQRAQAEARMKGAELAIEQAKSNLKRISESLQLAEKNLGRVGRLQDTKSVSQQDYDIAQSEFRSQKAAYDVAAIAESIAQFEWEQAKAALLHVDSEKDRDTSNAFSVTSPIHGSVLRVLQESAAVVQHGTPLLEVGDPLNIEIECDVLSSDAVKIREGNEVQILRWGGDQPLHGKVRRIEPSAFTKVSALGVEEQRVNVVIDIDEEPESRRTLGDAFRVDARIVYWKAEKVLRIPASALFRVENRWSVYRVRSGEVETVAVEVGHRNQEWAEVIQGLKEGDVFIRNPSDQIRNGLLVTPSNESQPAA